MSIHKHPLLLFRHLLYSLWADSRDLILFYNHVLLICLQDHQASWCRSVWYCEQGGLGESVWEQRGGREDATATGIGSRQEGQVPQGGSHHGTVSTSKHCQASWSGHCQWTCEWNTAVRGDWYTKGLLVMQQFSHGCLIISTLSQPHRSVCTT